MTSIATPSTQISPHKVRPFTYLLGRINESHPDISDIPRHALLIGAGCSLKCGIPLGSDIVKLCKLRAFLSERIPDNARILEDCKINIKEIEEKIKKKELLDEFEAFVYEKEQRMAQIVEQEKDFHIDKLFKYLKLKDNDIREQVWEQYKDSIIVDNRYGFWMNQYSEDAEERQRLIEEVMDNREPDGSYIILSYLIDKRKFTNVLTPNFDDLVNEAVMYYTEQRCRFYVDDELSQYISIHNKKPNIIKLHGDYRFANMKNTSQETDRLTSNIKLKLQELLRQLGLIVVGYNVLITL